MEEVITRFDHPTRAIVHFKEDAILCAQHGNRLIRYQVTIPATDDTERRSPSGVFVRFDHETSEIHGWVVDDDIMVEEYLEIEKNGEWMRVSNG